MSKTTLPQRRSVQGSTASNDASSAAAVSFLLGGAALNEACDILISQSSSSQTKPQNESNEDHCQKLAALYRKGKAAYNIISRTSDVSSSDRIPMMTPGNIAATSSAGSSAQTSSATSISHTPSARSRGSFTTPHGSYSKISSGAMHKKKLENGGGIGKRILNRSLSDNSDASNQSAHGSGGNGSNRTAGKIAINSSGPKKQQQRKSDPPPEVLNFLKALNAGGTATQTSSKVVGAATNNGRKQPTSKSVSMQNTRKRPPPPPPRSRQSSKSSEDEDHEEATVVAAESSSTRRTRSKRARTASSNTNRVYDIGESVFVQVDDKHYNAIIKNVDFKQFGGEAGDDNDAEAEQRPAYEIEFSDGEVWEDVDGDNVHSADEED